jgi:3'-5' exoribonuclease
MNNLSEQFVNVSDSVELMELSTPVNLAIMPKIFRLTSIHNAQPDSKCTQCTATLYHDSASLKVKWTLNRPDLRLKSGDLVSPRWLGLTTSEDGMIKISRLVLMERPEPWENLFHTVPHGWVKSRELVSLAAELFELMPRPYRFLFNAVFWDGQRFKRFCTVPSSMNGHHAEDNGNLRHAVEVAQLMQQYSHVRDLANEGMGILAGFLHDAGKADEYRLSPKGEWKLSDRGKLLGHKVTVIEWIAQARAKWNLLMQEDHYMALLHCLTCAPNAPEWLGIRKPAMLEAVLLSNMDRLSGTKDLMQRCAANRHGWGSYHAHLNGQPYRIDLNLKERGDDRGQD